MVYWKYQLQWLEFWRNLFFGQGFLSLTRILFGSECRRGQYFPYRLLKKLKNQTQRLIKMTGSKIDDETLGHYNKLFSDPTLGSS